MGRRRLKKPERHRFARYAFPVAMLWILLAFDAVIMGQHRAAGHFGGFAGQRAGGFSAGGFHGRFAAPPVLRGFSGPARLAFGAAPRRNWTAPHFNFALQRGAVTGYRPAYGAWNRAEDHRGRNRPRYWGNFYGGYPYLYANSWELLPWDLGYPDFTGYGDDNGASEPSNAQVEPSAGQQEEPPESDLYRPEYPSASYQPPTNQATASSPLRGEPELMLIFKDGHTQNIRNYMLTPSDVIIMDDAASGRTPRIPLSDLNLPATEKAAQRAGLDFSPPSA